jgi:hypothetical protein
MVTFVQSEALSKHYTVLLSVLTRFNIQFHWWNSNAIKLSDRNRQVIKINKQKIKCSTMTWMKFIFLFTFGQGFSIQYVFPLSQKGHFTSHVSQAANWLPFHSLPFLPSRAFGFFTLLQCQWIWSKTVHNKTNSHEFLYTPHDDQLCVTGKSRKYTS